MSSILLVQQCEYWTRYAGPCGGDGERPMICEAEATLALANASTRPMICVCDKHAARIVERFPELGTVAERFVPTRRRS
jgi:hypothetical protein